MLEHFRSIDVLPPGLADVYGTDFVIAGHQSNSISQTAVTISLTSLEIIENFQRTNKQADINRIVIPQIFSDADHSVSPGLDFHRIFQVENRIEFSVHGDV